MTAWFLLNGFDSRTDLAFGENPFLVWQPTDQFEFQPLVNSLRLIVVAKHIGSECQRQLGGTAAGGVRPVDPVVAQAASRQQEAGGWQIARAKVRNQTCQARSEQL